MKKIEIVLVSISLIAVILRVLDFPGGEVLSAVSFSTLGYFYIFLGFALFNGISFKEIPRKTAYQNTSPLMIFSAFAGGYALLVILNTISAKLLLREINPYLPLWLIDLLIVLIIIVFAQRRSKSRHQVNIYKRLTIAGVLSLILHLIPSATLIDIYYGGYPDYAETYKKLLNDPDNPDLKKQLRDLEYQKNLNQLDKIKGQE